MKDIFIISNQHGHFLGKQGQWLDDSEPTAVWRSPHRDVALNYLIESNARDIEQRMVLLQCPLNEKDIPLLGDAGPARKSAPVTFDEPAANTPADADNDEDDTETETETDDGHAADSAIDGNSVDENSTTDDNKTANTPDGMDVTRD